MGLSGSRGFAHHHRHSGALKRYQCELSSIDQTLCCDGGRCVTGKMTGTQVRFAQDCFSLVALRQLGRPSFDPERPMDKNDALGWMPCQLGYAP